MVRGYKINQSTIDHFKILSKSSKKTYRRPKNIKSGDSTEHSLSESVNIYQRSLNDDTGDSLHSFSIVSSPVNQCIEYYWSKYIVDRPGQWKSFFEDTVYLEIFVPSELALLGCIRFCFMTTWSVLTLQKPTILLIFNCCTL